MRFYVNPDANVYWRDGSSNTILHDGQISHTYIELKLTFGILENTVKFMQRMAIFKRFGHQMEERLVCYQIWAGCDQILKLFF